MTSDPHPESHPADRRNAPRHTVDEYAMASVRPDPPLPGSLDTSIPIFLRDVSFRGLGFYAPADRGLHVTQAVMVIHGPHESPARLRWVEPIGEGDWVDVGATFVDVMPEVLISLESLFHDDVMLAPPDPRLDQLAGHFSPPPGA